LNWLFVKRLRSFVMLAGVASFILNIVLLVPALYTMQVFDRVFMSGSTETLAMLSVLTLLFLALSYCLDTVRARALASAGRSLDRTLAPLAARAVLEHAASGAARADTDGMRDIGQLRSALCGPGMLAVFDAPWLPVYLVVIALMHPWLGAAATLGALLLAGLGVSTDLLTRAPADAALRRSRAASRFMETLARNAEAIVGMGMTRAAVARWQLRQDELLAAQQQHSALATGLSALARMFRQVLQIALLAIGAWLVIEKQASAGVMIAATILIGRALQPVEYLIGGWRMLVDARGAWQRLNERRAPENAAARVELEAPAGRIEVDRISFTLSASRPVLIRNVSFALEAGTSLGIIGPSAAGKTTLLRLLLGLWKPQAGVVRLDGADVTRWDRDALGAHVGYLPQDVALIAGTVGENIARLASLTAAGASEKIIRAAQLARAHEMILQLPDGYDTQIGEAGAALSGGQRQRIALARALYGDPPLVVLDEPSASLDSAGEAALLVALHDLKARGTTVVFVTHSPSFMAALDKLLVLKNGALEMFGPSAAVLARLRGTPADNRIVSFPARSAETHA